MPLKSSTPFYLLPEQKGEHAGNSSLTERFGKNDVPPVEKPPVFRRPEERTLYWMLKDLVKNQDSDGINRLVKDHGWIAVARMMPEEYFSEPPARKPAP